MFSGLVPYWPVCWQLSHFYYEHLEHIISLIWARHHHLHLQKHCELIQLLQIITDYSQSNFPLLMQDASLLFLICLSGHVAVCVRDRHTHSHSQSRFMMQPGRGADWTQDRCRLWPKTHTHINTKDSPCTHDFQITFASPGCTEHCVLLY